MAGDLVKIAAMWTKKKRDGEKYMKGLPDQQRFEEAVGLLLTGDYELIMFKNKHKQRDNQPDAIIYVAKKQQRGGGGGSGGGGYNDGGY